MERSSPIIRKRPVPLGWELRINEENGVLYYFNINTGQSQLEKPDSKRTFPSFANDPSLDPSSSSVARPSSKENPDWIICRHILIKHTLSDEPWDIGGKLIDRTKERALCRIEGLRTRILDGLYNFISAAVGYSDCYTSMNEGRLRPITVGSWEKEFEDVAFSLQVGQMSRTVETSAGYHLIQRIH